MSDRASASCLTLELNGAQHFPAAALDGLDKLRAAISGLPSEQAGVRILGVKALSPMLAADGAIADYIDEDLIGIDGKYMTATEVLKGMGIANPNNRQCKECGTALRERLGAPKRVKGRDKWRVPIAKEDEFETLNYPVSRGRPAPEDVF